MSNEPEKQALVAGVGNLVDTIERCTQALNEAVTLLLEYQTLTSKDVNALVVSMPYMALELQHKLQTMLVLH